MFPLLKVKWTSSDISAGLLPRIQTNVDTEDTDTDWLQDKTDWFWKAPQGRGCSHLQPEHTLFRLSGRQSDKQPLFPVSFNEMTHRHQGQGGWREPCSVEQLRHVRQDSSTSNLFAPSASHIPHTTTTTTTPLIKIYTWKQIFTKRSPEQRSWLHIWCVCRLRSRCCTWRRHRHHCLSACLSHRLSSTHWQTTPETAAHIQILGYLPKSSQDT